MFTRIFAVVMKVISILPVVLQDVGAAEQKLAANPSLAARIVTVFDAVDAIVDEIAKAL